MTTNQINYQKAQAEIAEREAQAKQIQLENEMQHLENVQEKYWHYGISPTEYVDQRAVKSAYPLEAYRRGISEARSLFGLFGDAASLYGVGGTKGGRSGSRKGKM